METTTESVLDNTPQEQPIEPIIASDNAEDTEQDDRIIPNEAIADNSAGS